MSGKFTACLKRTVHTGVFVDELCLISTGHYVAEKRSLLVASYRQVAFGREGHITA